MRWRWRIWQLLWKLHCFRMQKWYRFRWFLKKPFNWYYQDWLAELDPYRPWIPEERKRFTWLSGPSIFGREEFGFNNYPRRAFWADVLLERRRAHGRPLKRSHLDSGPAGTHD